MQNTVNQKLFLALFSVNSKQTYRVFAACVCRGISKQSAVTEAACVWQCDGSVDSVAAGRSVIAADLSRSRYTPWQC